MATTGFYQSPAWKRLRRQTLHRDSFRCRVGGPDCLGRASEADHITARADGGADELANLQASCRPCNLWKARESTAARYGQKRRRPW